MSTDDNIKLAKDGQPFKSEYAAQVALGKLELPTEVWGVMPYQGGWAIRTHQSVLAEQAMGEQAKSDATRASGINDEKYFFVIFPGKSSPQDTEKVEIGWQGLRITVSREKQVALPQRFIGVCDNAVQQLFEPAARGTQAYVRAGELKRRSYRLIGPATREDFLKQWAEGNDITRRSVQAAGGKPMENSAPPV